MTPDDTLTAEIVEDVCKLWADQGMQVSLDHCMVEALITPEEGGKCP